MNLKRSILKATVITSIALMTLATGAFASEAQNPVACFCTPDVTIYREGYVNQSRIPIYKLQVVIIKDGLPETVTLQSIDNTAMAGSSSTDRTQEGSLKEMCIEVKSELIESGYCPEKL